MNKSPVIVSNQIKCLICNDEIYSAHRHDFKYCKCGSIAVDGGTDYLRRVGDMFNYEDKSIVLESALVDSMLQNMTEAEEFGKNTRGILYAAIRAIRDCGYSIKKENEMTRTNKEVEEKIDFDLKEFKLQKDKLAKIASKDVASKIQEIKTLLKEIKELVELSGITVDIRELRYDMENVEELHPDWNSSSYDCP